MYRSMRAENSSQRLGLHSSLNAIQKSINVQHWINYIFFPFLFLFKFIEFNLPPRIIRCVWTSFNLRLHWYAIISLFCCYQILCRFHYRSRRYTQRLPPVWVSCFRHSQARQRPAGCLMIVSTCVLLDDLRNPRLVPTGREVAEHSRRGTEDWR